MKVNHPHRVQVLLLIVNLLLSLCFLLWQLTSQLDESWTWQLIWELRLPALLTAWLVGISLTLSAAMLQMLLSNPLADPGIIGLNSGASLGAAVVLLGAASLGWQFQAILIPLACFVGAVCSALLIFFLAKRIGNLSGASVILAGIAISTIAGAMIAWLYLLADASAIRNLTFWLMGSLHQASMSLILPAFFIVVVLTSIVFRQAGRFNLLYLGADIALSHGLHVRRFEISILLIASALVALAVSLAGSIAFVGLIVPHLVRQIIGFDYRYLLPISALSGVLVMLIVLMTSHWLNGILLPVSLLTASVGGPLFIYILIRQQGKAHFGTR